MATDSSRREWELLLVLAAIQFTNILDFVILMPLGPQLMRIFSVSPQQFGLVVSAYTLSAGIMGFLGGFFLDRFDRKAALLTLYAGFAIGTFLCAVAPTYGFLLAARVVTGACGGVLAATIFAVVGDAIPDSRRGAATGTIMSSFSAASVFGIPLGLYLANLYSWHTPFFLIAGTSGVLFILAYRLLPSMKMHTQSPEANERPIAAMKALLTHSAHLRTFAFSMGLMLAGFAMFPYIATYLVLNAGMDESHLPYVYFFGGGSTVFTARFIGKLADRYGKTRVFTWLAVLSVVPILAVTNMPQLPLPVVLIVTTVFFIVVSGRMTPAIAMITATVEPHRRGRFMSVNSSVQQLSAGIASYGAGLIIGKASNGSLTNFGIVGLIAAATTLVCIYLAKRLRFVDAAVPHRPHGPKSSEGTPEERAVIREGNPLPDRE
ncbi:MAG TPA: MFS transporter [Bacteroidota bacterium]|nr:MFS transporter [Bacteroidota bacterium]